MLYKKAKLDISAAALSYYLTMTIFPLLICLYTLLGRSNTVIMQIIAYAERFFLPETVKLIQDFMAYVAANNSSHMMLAGIVLMGSYASAAVRTMQRTVYTMQGGERFRGIVQFLVSVAYSVTFLVAVYCAALILVTGQQFIDMVNQWIPFLDINSAWVYIRFAVLAGIFFCILWGLYETPKRKTDRYSTLPGAAVGTVLLLLVSLLFSSFISRSGRYSLVYGSLSSIILMMLWLYSSCLVMCIGAALNIVIGRRKEVH